ncbi:hypothetical protein Z517_08217 [Fonsecaea pedrosoi CBS 271.37]|uniref:ABM domain-containing protein n=1 Tax=Fonsecaea pedrosoi CBS 271.37 TaxID=1442368 RepID=A0A0D2EVW7_9EURO|nr:uncharacterized protein Z517_08217 [Fonsecaea pedrosoi CBS 271.37]KIW78382.1 hypothetical protein Z517_08217 [Fonsecaea pedrosoi CBS 271.37]
MTTPPPPPASVQTHRDLVPINTFTSSTGQHGSLMVTDIYILPDKLDEYVRLVAPVVRTMRDMPECLFCEISQDPTDAAHIRIQHSWTEGTDWFVGANCCARELSSLDIRKQACESQQWFADYVKGLAGIADMSRGRNVAHFNRIPID